VPETNGAAFSATTVLTGLASETDTTGVTASS